jgi:tetratricopeptide (TPR) repeat protein
MIPMSMWRKKPRRLNSDAIESADVLVLLGSLIEKSLVLHDDLTGRYRLLETVRQYGIERLVEHHEEDGIRDRHLASFLALAERAEPHLTDADQKEWLDRLDIEHENLRSALEWSAADPAHTDLGLTLAGAIWRFWELRGYLHEGREWLAKMLSARAGSQTLGILARALAGAGTLAVRQGDFAAARMLQEGALPMLRKLGDRRGIAVSLNGLGSVAYQQGDFEAAHTLYSESLAIGRELGDRMGISASLINLGNVAYARGDYDSARKIYEESLAIRRKLGDLTGIANSLQNLAVMTYAQTDYPTARSLLEESLAIRRELGDRLGIARSLGNLGYVVFELGEYAAASALHKESLIIRRELGDQLGIAEALEGIASIAAVRSDCESAGCLWGASERLREEIGSPQQPIDLSKHEREIATARNSMGDDLAFDAAWQLGRHMMLEQVVAFALEEIV